MAYKDYLYMYYCIQYTKELASGLPPPLGSVQYAAVNCNSGKPRVVCCTEHFDIRTVLYCAEVSSYVS